MQRHGTVLFYVELDEWHTIDTSVLLSLFFLFASWFEVNLKLLCASHFNQQCGSIGLVRQNWDK